MLTERDVIKIIENGAYHEAGHTVMAYEVGWVVHYVEIECVGNGTRDYTASTCSVYDNDMWRILISNCAGTLAGWKHLDGEPHFHTREDIFTSYQDLEYAEKEHGAISDVDSSIIAIISENSSSTPEEVYRIFHEHEKECWEMLQENWGKVEVIASELLKHGKIEQKEIEGLLMIRN